MERLLKYLSILVVTALFIMATLAIGMRFLNGSVDFSVVAGSSIVIVPVLTVFFIVYLEFLIRFFPSPAIPVAACWIILIAAYILMRSLGSTVLFYGVPMALLSTLMLPSLHRYRLATR